MVRFLNSVLLLTVLTLYAIIPTAQAQKILQDFKKPLPTLQLLPLPDFEAATKSYHEVPMGDKSLAYKVRIPSDWESVGDMSLSSYSLNSKILGEVSKFFSPPRLEAARSFFSMQAMRLEYQLTAEQWLLQYLLTSGYNIQGLESNGENSVEALYVLIEHDVSYIVRAKAQTNGKRIILAQYYLPVELWDAEKVMQAQVVASFDLENPEDEFVENMLEYHFLDIAEVKYPETWQLRAPPLRSIDVMSVELLNAAGEEGAKGKLTLNGKMEIKLVSMFSAESLNAEKEKMKAELESTGLSMGTLIEKKEDFKFNPAFTDTVVEAYDAIDSGNNLVSYELWFTMMQSGDYYYFITLLTPARDEDFFIWSRNTQTYKVVISQIAPQEESRVED